MSDSSSTGQGPLTLFRKPSSIVPSHLDLHSLRLHALPLHPLALHHRLLHAGLLHSAQRVSSVATLSSVTSCMTPTRRQSMACATAMIRLWLLFASACTTPIPPLATLVPVDRCKMHVLAVIGRRQVRLQGTPRSARRRQALGSHTACLRHAAAVSCIAVPAQLTFQ